MDKQQQQQSGRREKNLNSFIHTLPKANQIFQVLQHVKKSIYPFQMKTNTHQFLQRPIEPYVREGLGEGKSGGDGRGKPVFQSVEQYFAGQGVVYDKFNNNADQQLFNQNIYPLSKLKNLKNLDYMTQIPYTQPLTHPDPSLLHFNSRFESGNLSLAALHSETYYLLLHNDVNTSGYTSWFYFQVRAPRKGRYRFVILNYGKAGLMHREGVRICVYGGGDGGNGGTKGWRRGGERIWCQGNAGLYRKGMYTGFNSLGFQYQFLEDNSQVYFSYNVPYTYNDLCCFLDEIEQKKYPYFNRKLAGISLAGNRLQAITITNFSLLAQGHDLPVIILMARSHPGETVSSWIMHEYIKFLLSDTPEAISLRNNFVFKMFPMINPDGVIHGNYRCSLSGRDLNRRWNQTNKELFPEVYFIRNQIVEISRRKNIKMILDLHGHTKKKKIFAYGCNNKNQPHRCRLFPYILSKLSPHFEFRYCNFCISKYKYGTARISLYNELRIPYIYTIESSQFGIFQGHLNLGVFTDIASAIGRGCLALFRVRTVIPGKGQGNVNEETNSEGLDNFENELLNDSSLIKIGSEKDSGSESEPSVDNIKFDKLNQMNKRRQMRYNTASKVNSQTKKPNGHQRLKSSTNTSQSLQKIRKSIPVRPKTSQGNTQKYVEEEPKNNVSFIQKRIHSMNRPFAERARSAPKTEITANQITKPLQNRRRAQALNFINLSLSIFDETKSNRSYRTGTKIDSYTDFNEGLLNKLRLAPRNYIQFRRIK